MPRLRRVGDAAQTTIGHLQPCSALNVNEKSIDRAFHERHFETLSIKRAALDGGPVVIFNKARRCLPGKGKIGVKALRPVGVIDVDKISGAPEKRYLEPIGANSGGHNFRFIKPRDESV